MPPAIGTPLPDAEHAVISQKKLEDYVLSVQHPVGRNKARVFLATLGIESTDWNYLRDAILAGLTAAPITVVESTPYGHRCTVVMTVEGVNGQRQEIVTAWLAEEDQPPRLITAYVDL